MTRQQIWAEIFRRAEEMGLSRKTWKLATGERGQRLIMSMYELEQRRANGGIGKPPAEEPLAPEMTRLLIMAGRLAWEHYQAAEEVRA